MSTNVDAIESSSDVVVSSAPPSNSDIAVSNGVTVVVGAESLGSGTETLTIEPSSGGVIVQGLVDDARVSGGELGIVIDNGEKLLDESSPDAAVSSEPPPSNSDIAVSNGVGVGVGIGVVVGVDSLDSKTETFTMEPSSDVVVSSVLPAASYGVKTGDDLLESKSGTLIMETSDHDGGGNIVASDSIDDAKVSRDVTGIVIESSELVLDKPVSDVTDIVIEAVNGTNIGADSLGSKTETLTMKPSADQHVGRDIAVQDSVDGSRVFGDEKGIVTEIIEKVSDENEVDNDKKEGDYNLGDDIAVQDSIDNSRVSTDEKEIVTETLEKVSDENVVNNEEKEGECNVGGGIPAEGSIVDSGVSGDEKGIVTENIEKVSDEIEVFKVEKEGEHNGGDDIVAQGAIDDSRVSGDEKEIVTENIEKVSDEIEVFKVEKEGEHNGGDDIVAQDAVDDSRVSGDEKEIVTENIERESVENEVNNEEKEGEYKVTDLVWAKVKNYPWWPGQIFDPSSSTDVAKKHSNKKGFLVGYFGDQTFAWNKASKIRPFRKHFCKLEKQSNSKAFFHAVNCALDEVSRRVDFGLACSCLSKEVCDKIKSQVFVNAGIRKEDSKVDGGDRFSTVSTFKPVKVVQSVQDLAREHFDGFSRLEVLSVRTQLLAFFRWKGYYQFQTQNILDGLDNKLEDESELPLTEENKVVEDEKPASVGDKVSSKKRKPDVCDSDDSVPLKKERSLTNVTPKGNSSVKGSKKNISKKATVEDEKPASAGKKVSSKKRKPDSSDSDDSVPLKKERSLKNVTPKGNSSVKGSKKNVSKKETVEDEKPVSAGKKVSSKKRKPDTCDNDDSVPLKKERNSNVKGSKSNIRKKATVKDNNIFKVENENEKQGSVSKKVSSKERKLDDCDSDDSIPHKKERSLTNNRITPKGNSSVKRSKKSISKKATVEGCKEENRNGIDIKKSSISSPKKLFRVGDSICRIAKQISESPSILKKES